MSYNPDMVRVEMRKFLHRTKKPLSEIASEAGVTAATLRKLSNGKAKRLQQGTADKLGEYMFGANDRASAPSRAAQVKLAKAEQKVVGLAAENAALRAKIATMEKSSTSSLAIRKRLRGMINGLYDLLDDMEEGSQ